MKFLLFIPFVCLLFFCFLIFSFQVQSQNLVPNPSFEDTANCATEWGIDVAFPWFQPTPATSDYYSAYTSCGIDIYNNGNGYQIPRTGVAFAGIWCYVAFGASTRDYIEVPLLDTLKGGQKYCVEFYVSRANESMYAMDRIGAYLSIDSVTSTSTDTLPYIPQVDTFGNIIYDTLNWILVSGEYIATGGEKFLTIGNFYSNNSTNADSIGGAFPNVGYYYIDDVSVTLCDTANGYDEILLLDQITIYPNPCTSSLTLSVNSKIAEIITSVEVFNLLGQKITEVIAPSYNTIQLNTSEWKQGIYFLQINSPRKSIPRKIMKINY